MTIKQQFKEELGVDFSREPNGGIRIGNPDKVNIVGSARSHS
jgi:hypothetical protein